MAQSNPNGDFTRDHLNDQERFSPGPAHMDISKAHMDMVIQLQKPGELILGEMSGKEAQIVHMFFGVIGELGEMFEILFASPEGRAVDTKHFMEELGDYIFFLRAQYALNNIEEPSIGELDINAYRSKVDVLLEIVTASAKLADTLKRPIIYRKEAKQPLKPILDRFYAIYWELIHIFSLSHGKVLQGNMDKLLTGDNARYAAGIYSNAQANARADKKGEPDEQV